MKGGGILRSKKAIKIPGGKHEVLPILTAQDHTDLIEYAIKHRKIH